MEFLWRPSKSLGESAQIFSGAFHSGNYGPPKGFCFDQLCSDQPLQDDQTIEEYNVQQRVDEFVSRVQNLAHQTAGDDVMLEMGGDFHYENANLWYENLDLLIEATNRDGRVNAFYSTPLNYTKAKLSDLNSMWSVKNDDFFPYSDW